MLLIMRGPASFTASAAAVPYAVYFEDDDDVATFFLGFLDDQDDSPVAFCCRSFFVRPAPPWTCPGTRGFAQKKKTRADIITIQKMLIN